MAGTFTVACAQTINGSSSTREVNIQVSSQNGYYGTVTLTFSAVPNTGTVSLNDDTELVSVPKNGSIDYQVMVTFENGASSCQFTANGTDGTLNPSHTITVNPKYGNGHQPPSSVRDSKVAAKPAKPKAPKK
jgi:hypothetical protein